MCVCVCLGGKARTETVFGSESPWRGEGTFRLAVVRKKKDFEWLLFFWTMCFLFIFFTYMYIYNYFIYFVTYNYYTTKTGTYKSYQFGKKKEKNEERKKNANTLIIEKLAKGGRCMH